MVTHLRSGHYRLIETRRQIKILALDDTETYAWIWSEAVGELLISSHSSHHTDHILATGEYKLYDVTDEPELTDLEHLELSIGEGRWQGYLLLSGLPTDTHTKVRIIPTTECITGSTA